MSRETEAIVLAARMRQLDERLELLSPGSTAPLLPGLSPQEIDDLTAALPFPLPLDVRVWFEWHNGKDSSIPSLQGAPWCGITLEESLYMRTMLMAFPLDNEWQYDTFKGGRWLPLMGSSQDPLVADCSNAGATTSTLHYLDLLSDGASWEDSQYSGVAALIEMWHYCIDQGWWVPRETRTGWYSRAPIPEVFHRLDRFRGYVHDPYLP